MSDKDNDVTSLSADDKFVLLALRYLDALTAPEEEASLRAQLAESADRRAEFVSLAGRHGMMAEIPVLNVAETTATTGKSFKTSWAFRVAALAASLAIVAAGYWFLSSKHIAPLSALATIQSVDGSVEIARSGKTASATAGVQILEQDMVVASSNGLAEIKYAAEETTLKLLAGSTAKFWLQDNAKRVRLDAGKLVCSVAKQPSGKSMRFITPQAEAEVLGTELTLAVADATTRMEVIQGSVRLIRNDNASVIVEAGEFAVAGAGWDLKAEPIRAAAAILPGSAAFYVDANAPNAADANSGTEEEPWKTIQHAADTLQPGGTVFIKAGIYTEEVSPARSGREGAWITYSAFPGQERQAVIAGAFAVRQKSYIKVSGLKIQKAPSIGILVEGPGVSNVTISGNWIYDTGSSGIAAWGVPWTKDPASVGWRGISGLIIESNLVELACDPALPGGGWNEQVTIANGVDRFEISDNTIRNGGISSVNGRASRRGGAGLDCKEGVSNGRIRGNEICEQTKCGIYLDAGASPPAFHSAPAPMRNLEVYNNRIHDVAVKGGGHGIEITSAGRGTIDGIKVYNNLIYGNACDGILVYRHPQGIGTAKNISIVNNTVCDNNTSGEASYGGIHINDNTASGVLVRNNIVFGNLCAQIKIDDGSEATCDHNLTK